MSHSGDYVDTITLGEYKFLNVRKAHLYALSNANTPQDYPLLYLEAAGPQLVLLYFYTSIGLDLVFLERSPNIFNPTGNWITRVRVISISPFILYHDLNETKAHIISKKFAIPIAYSHGLHVNVDKLCKTINDCWDYADNYKYARDLLLKYNLDKHISSECYDAPMTWCIENFKMYLNRKEFFDMLNMVLGVA